MTVVHKVKTVRKLSILIRDIKECDGVQHNHRHRHIRNRLWLHLCTETNRTQRHK
jgi:hypothetical protein